VAGVEPMTSDFTHSL